jgi:hypothetical protein
VRSSESKTRRRTAARWALVSSLMLVGPSQLHAQESLPRGDRASADGAPEAVELPRVRLTAEPGRGVTMDAGETFSLNLWGRLQVRSTTTWVSGSKGTREPEQSVRPSTVRLRLSGHVLDENVAYDVQLAFGSEDLEEGSPIFDAFVELTHLRDLNVRVGQFFVPFDRARRMSEWGLQTIERSLSVRDLAWDRDVGVAIQSEDLFGLDGRLVYHLGVFGGEGRNLVGTRPLGFLYVARVGVRPFGDFDDDVESDLERREEVRMLIGAALAYDQRSARQDGNTGEFFELGSVDYLGLEADVMLKYRGLFVFGEILYRRASRAVISGIGPAGEPLFEWPREGFGYVLQAGYAPVVQTDVWLRWDHLRPHGPTDPAWVDEIARQGRELAVGTNYYANGHRLKLQAEYAYAFGGRGDVHQARLQLDASF